MQAITKSFVFRISSFLLLFASYAGNAQKASPKAQFPGLFEQVQLSRIFSDSKVFPDMIPLRSPEWIMKKYIAQTTNGKIDLRKFIDSNFTLPENKSLEKSNINNLNVRTHIESLWPVLRRTPEPAILYNSLLTLPNEYVVPGGRFREIYYWDSYFTMLGLQESNKIALIHNMVDNFAFLIRQYGFIPNGNRTYYLTRSQPPFFSKMVELLAEEQGNMVYLNNLDALNKEYLFWMDGEAELKLGMAKKHVVKLNDGSVLNRYWDSSDQPREESYAEDVAEAKKSSQKEPDFYRNVRSAAESGWDFSSRWFEDGLNLHTIITTDLLAVDLNTLLYHLELSIAKGYELKGDSFLTNQFKQKAINRKIAMQKYFWSEEQKWFVDYNWKKQKKSDQKTLAGLFPLYMKIANNDQAKHVAEITEKEFLKPGGLVTTLVASNQQWDAPNAWAPLQWVGIEGFINYKHKKLADTIAKRWIDLNISVFKNTGKLMEKYNVIDKTLKAGGGEYPSQDGFGWTNGVLLKLMNKQAIPAKNYSPN